MYIYAVKCIFIYFGHKKKALINDIVVDVTDQSLFYLKIKLSFFCFLSDHVINSINTGSHYCNDYEKNCSKHMYSLLFTKSTSLISYCARFSVKKKAFTTKNRHIFVYSDDF